MKGIFMINIKDKAPEINLSDENGKLFNISDFRGNKVVVYFYPKDSTSGCTKHALGFKNLYAEFEKNNVTIVGISKDSANSHKRFIEKYELPFRLLVDSNLDVAKAYGAVKLKKRTDGSEALAIERMTFLIDENGEIEMIIHNIKPDEIATKVLEAVIKQ